MKNIKKIAALSVILCAVMVLITGPLVFALEPHEDAELAKLVYSSISLLRYYSESLDFMLRKNAEEVETRLDKMPFANIPENLREPTDNFATSGISISYLILNIDRDLSEMRLLSKQSRFDKAIELSTRIYLNLSQAYGELSKLEEAAEDIGTELKMASAPPESDVKKVYNEVLEKIRRVKELLDLFMSFLLSSTLNFQAVLNYMLLHPTAITLNITPAVAYVGDNIHFEGLLTSGNEPLAGREIDITLDGSRYITVKTDNYGKYDGVLQIPYWYVPEIEVQAIFLPKGKDAGLYMASLSPIIKVKVLFYEAKLELKVDKKAYPGLETTITGKFDYGQAPLPENRNVEIYLDNVFMSQFVAQETFTHRIQIAPQTKPGKHNITVSSEASKRYAPVVAEAVLNVTQETPILDLDTPKVAIIPGSVGLSGRIYSEIGPLSGASITMGLGKSQLDMKSSENGIFETEIKTAWDLNFVGSQVLTIKVAPDEPWHAPLLSTRTFIIVNTINCGAILVILVLLGIYLPARLGKRPRLKSGRVEDIEQRGGGEDKREPRTIIFYLYRLAVKLIQGITKALLRPQQTLREFAKENGKALGPAAGYFMELTRMVERVLYSPHKPTEEDVTRSEHLSHGIEESKREVV